MTTTSETMTMEGLVVKTAVFGFSLVLGLVAGAVALGGGWLLWTQTSLVADLTQFLGITAATPWYLSRSAGVVGYLLLTGSTLWGLLLSTKLIKEIVPAVLSLAMHNVLSWLALALSGAHALALLFDSYYSYSLADLTVPFLGPYRPGWVALGIIGFYLMALTSISFQFRRRLGQKRWRRLHYLTFAVYALATSHGVMAGSDSGTPGMTVLYWGSGLLVLFMTNFRLLVKST